MGTTDCSCPYDYGGICKHCVAVLLTCVRGPERVHEQPPLSELIADADRETLETLLVELSENVDMIVTTQNRIKTD